MSVRQATNGRELTSALAQRISVVVSAVVALLLLSPMLRIPVVVVPLQALGSPLRLGMSRELAVVVVAALLAWVGTHAVFSLHPDYLPGTRIYSHRLLPTMATIAAGIFWQRQVGAAMESRLLMAAALALALTFVLMAQYASMSGDAPWFVRLRTVLGVVSLSIGLYLLIIIYGTRARSLVTATAAAAVGFAVALDIFQYEAVAEWRVLRSAAIAGLIVGECSWALNFWRLDPLRAGFVLLIVIYVFAGLMRRQLQGTLGRFAVLEHAFMVAILVVVMNRLGI
ncbi:MAG: DUF5656 family protein [Anaerolineae bacterium]